MNPLTPTEKEQAAKALCFCAGGMRLPQAFAVLEHLQTELAKVNLQITRINEPDRTTKD